MLDGVQRKLSKHLANQRVQVGRAHASTHQSFESFVRKSFDLTFGLESSQRHNELGILPFVDSSVVNFDARFLQEPEETDRLKIEADADVLRD
jgi:hypothetical protein